MKISNETKEILKNFAQIHQSFLFKPGSVISTIDGQQGSVFVKATVEEVFPQEAFIYDLNQLLMYLNVMQDPDITFGESSLQVKSDSGKLTYFYAAKALMKYKVPSGVTFDPFYTMKLSGDDITLINKAAAITSSPNIEFVSDGDVVKLRTFNPKNTTANVFEKEWNISAPTFRVQIPVENFKLLTDDYDVDFSSTRALRFTAKNRKLEYYIAMQPDSTFEV